MRYSSYFPFGSGTCQFSERKLHQLSTTIIDSVDSNKLFFPQHNIFPGRYLINAFTFSMCLLRSFRKILRKNIGFIKRSYVAIAMRICTHT